MVSTSIGRPLRVGRLGLRDELVEPFDDLLLGFGEPFADAIEKTHYVIPVRFSAGEASAPRRPRRRCDCRPALPPSASAIGSSTPCLRPSASAARGRFHAFGHHLHAGHDFGNRPAVRQLDADVPVAAERAGARQHEIAEPAQSGERLAAPADGARQARDLGEAARNQRGERVLSETEPLDHAGGNRDDVLQRAADLDADDVGARRTA